MISPSTPDLVAAIEVYIVNLYQDKPYLGSLRDGETVNESAPTAKKTRSAPVTHA